MKVLFRREGGRDLFSFQPMEGPRCLSSIPFKFEGAKRVFIFSFFPLSQCVPTVFPLSSNECSPTCSLFKHLTFISYALANVVLLSPICWAEGRNYIHQNRTFYFEEPP